MSLETYSMLQGVLGVISLLLLLVAFSLLLYWRIPKVFAVYFLGRTGNNKEVGVLATQSAEENYERLLGMLEDGMSGSLDLEYELERLHSTVQNPVNVDSTAPVGSSDKTAFLILEDTGSDISLSSSNAGLGVDFKTEVMGSLDKTEVMGVVDQTEVMEHKEDLISNITEDSVVVSGLKLGKILDADGNELSDTSDVNGVTELLVDDATELMVESLTEVLDDGDVTEVLLDDSTMVMGMDATEVMDIDMEEEHGKEE